MMTHTSKHARTLTHTHSHTLSLSLSPTHTYKHPHPRSHICANTRSSTRAHRWKCTLTEHLDEQHDHGREPLERVVHGYVERAKGDERKCGVGRVQQSDEAQLAATPPAAIK